MSAASETAALRRRRIAQVSEFAPGSIGDMLHFELLDCDPEAGDYLLSCRTERWDAQPRGRFTAVSARRCWIRRWDLIPYCLKTGAGIAPTVQLSVNYHRPLNPGAEVIIKVHVVSVSRSLSDPLGGGLVKGKPRKNCACPARDGSLFWKPAQ